MKKLLIATIFIIGCVSTNIDPTNNVSFDSYKSCITQNQKNLSGIKSRFQVAKAADKSHSAAWWDAQIGLIDDTMQLNSQTLAGTAPVKS